MAKYWPSSFLCVFHYGMQTLGSLHAEVPTLEKLKSGRSLIFSAPAMQPRKWVRSIVSPRKVVY